MRGNWWFWIGVCRASQLQSQLLLLNVQMFKCFDVQTFKCSNIRMFKMFTCIAIAQVGVCEATGDSELGSAPLCLCLLQPPIKEHRYLGRFYFLGYFHILFYFKDLFFVSYLTFYWGRRYACVCRRISSWAEINVSLLDWYIDQCMWLCFFVCFI